MYINDQVMDEQERIGFRLRSLYSDHGYSRYKMGKFEEYDLYSQNKDFLLSKSVITFTDTNGRLMALKPDVTLSIVKNGRDLPGQLRKLYYHENVYRVSAAENGFRELTQVGLECTGAVDVRCLAEVLLLAAESLKLCSENFILEVSHLGILSAFAEKITANEAVRNEILHCAGEKNLHGISQICSSHGIPWQDYTNRSDIPGGTTLGSLSETQVPLRTADIGLAQLAMHSCFETAGARDTISLAAFSEAFYSEPLPELVSED